MNDGVSVYGNYESTDWTRCVDSTTSLQNQSSGVGIIFGPSVTQETVLDGFRVVGSVAALGAAIVADGARGARVSNVQVSNEISALNGASLEIVATFSGRVTATGARVSIDGSGTSGVALEDAPGSRVENTNVHAASLLSSTTTITAIRILGDADGIQIRGNTLNATGPGYAVTALSAEACLGELVISGNSVLADNPTSGYVAGQPPTYGLHVVGDCSALVEDNSVVSVGGNRIDNVAIACDAPCVIHDNPSVYVNKSGTVPAGLQGGATGIRCERCSEISDSNVIGLVSPSGRHLTTSFQSTGVVVTGPTLVARNHIVGGCSFDAVGVAASNARLENNVIQGRPDDVAVCGDELHGTYWNTSSGVVAYADTDIHSNLIRSVLFGDTTASAVVVAGSGVSIQNNILQGSSYDVRSSGALWALRNNALFRVLAASSLDPYVLSTASTEAEVNALSGASGNFIGSCAPHLKAGSPCIDAGTSAGAPVDDWEGEIRDAMPDVGPDEWSAAGDVCFGVTCSGHGTCVGDLTAFCLCDSYYFRPDDAPTNCAPNACATNHGGCDPLTTCTPSLGGRTCGDCPTDYSGSGTTGCVPIGPCQPSPCLNNTACHVTEQGAACACAPGVLGSTCGGGSLESLSLGTQHACARTNEAYCWGANDEGQSTVPAGTYVLGVASGGRHTCGVRSTSNNWGPIVCWGANDHGQSTPPSGDDFVGVVAGDDHSCGRRLDGTIECWGSNTVGQATPPAGQYTVMVAAGNLNCAFTGTGVLTCWGANESGQATPPATTALRPVSIGGRHGCLIRSNNTLECWGANDYGQATPPSGNFQAVACSGNRSCGHRNNGTIECWGSNSYGESSPPAGAFLRLAVGPTFGCATKLDNAISCWGDNRFGEAMAPGGTFVAVSSSDDHGCALGVAGYVACWGAADAGQSLAPAADFVAVAAGRGFTCGVHLDGTLACWGSGLVESPPAGGGFITASAGISHACAIDESGGLHCWGDDSFGQAQPPGGPFTSLALGERHSCALDTAGTVHCWGAGDIGQLAVPSGSFVDLSAASDHTCGVRVDGTLACWGANYTAPPAGSFEAVTCGPTHDCAVGSDGSVVCWGDDDSGQLTSPAGEFFTVSSGFPGRTCGIRTDHSLACWGEMAR
jgi:alpha-tubulin suppressor-like RCC1 family protein